MNERETKLKELELWMNDIVKPVKVKLTGAINEKLIRRLKETPITEFDKVQLSMSLGCARHIGGEDIYDSDEKDVPVHLFLKWLQKYPEFKQRWADLNGFLNEIKKYRPLNNMSMDDAIEYVAEELKVNTEKHYLHKQQRVHTPDSCLTFNLSERALTDSENNRFHQIARYFLNSGCLCYGMHNGRVVFKIKDYFVAAPPIWWATKFNIERKDAKGNTHIDELTNSRLEKITKTIAAYGDYVSHKIEEILGSDAFEPKYYFFDATEYNNIENNNIYSKIKHYYNDELNAVDMRTNTPLAESFFKLIGWLFSPKDKNQRIAGCFECSASGIGKTSFIKWLCKRTEVVHSYMSQPVGRANHFSFAASFVDGPDVITVDDPCNGASDILSKVSDVVSNNSTDVELKSKDRYYIENVFTRFYISCNVPLYMRNDKNNFMTKKLFVLKASDIADNKEHIASEIVSYITYCDKREVHQFLTYCVDLYQENKKQFIADHLGLYIDHETVSNLFADMLNENAVKDTNNHTLIECIFEGRKENNREWNEELLKNWNKITKFIKDNYSEMAAKTVCSVPTDNRVYTAGNRPSKSRYKNYTLTSELRSVILKLIKDGNDGDTHDDDFIPTYKGVYEDLVRCDT